MAWHRACAGPWHGRVTALVPLVTDEVMIRLAHLNYSAPITNMEQLETACLDALISSQTLAGLRQMLQLRAFTAGRGA